MKKKKAYWIRKTHLFRRDEYFCSACGARADKPSKVCPNCSAPMKGSKYDATWVDEMEEFDAIFEDK